MQKRLLLLGALLALALLAYATGLYEYLAPDRMRELVRGAGPFGPVVIVALFAVMQPFGVPGALFLLVVVSLWPFEVALGINYAGAVGAGMVGFACARFFGRATIEHRMPVRLREWDDRLSQRGLPVVIGFRFMLFLNPASHWALGLSQVAVPTALLGTLIGFAPWVVAWTWFGAEILVWLEEQTLAIVGVGLAIGVVYYVHRRRRRASGDSSSERVRVNTPT